MTDPAPAPRRRRRLGRMSSFAGRSEVHLCADALEIDTAEGFEIETRRVFFSDVRLILSYRLYSRWGLWLTGLSTGFSVLAWLLALFSPASDAAQIAFWVGVVPNLPFLAIFLIPYAEVTVFGKRTKATMSWHFRHARAAEVYAELVALVERAQARERAELAGRAATVVAVPLPTPEDLAPPAAPVPAPGPVFEELGDPGSSTPSA